MFVIIEYDFYQCLLQKNKARKDIVTGKYSPTLSTGAFFAAFEILFSENTGSNPDFSKLAQNLELVIQPHD